MTTCHRYMLATLLTLAIMGTSALGKTKLIQSWADPSVTNYKFSKLLTVAIIDAPEIRRIAEAAMARVEAGQSPLSLRQSHGILFTRVELRDSGDCPPIFDSGGSGYSLNCHG